MNLTNADKYKWYVVSALDVEDETIKSRFYKLGILPGATVKLKRRAPIFRDPLLIQVDESQVALSKQEASYVIIQEIH